MNSLRVSLFGKLRVRCGEHVLPNLPARRAQELLGYLLLYRDRPLSRDTLAGALWDDCAVSQSRKCLRQALWQLQAALDTPTAAPGARLLLIGPDGIQVNPEADLWLDVAVFEQAFARAQAVPLPELDAQSVQSLREAVQLYHGDLLEGCYQTWCLCERERLQNMYLAMLDRLMGYCEAHREYETGRVYGAHILRCDRACERTHRRLMRLHYLAGDRTAALRQYEQCAVALAEALDATPGKRTVALYEQIRGDAIGGPRPAPAAAGTSPEVTAPPLPAVLGHLQQLRTSLADLQRQVQEAIQSVELSLTGRH